MKRFIQKGLIIFSFATSFLFNFPSIFNNLYGIDKTQNKYIIKEHNSLSIKGDTVLLAKNDSTNDTISIIGVGDMMLGSNYPDSTYLPPHDGRKMLSSVKKYLLDSDITFGNLEGALLTEEGSPKKCKDPKVCYAFKSPNHYVKHYKDAGFDLLNLANNHSGDFGFAGRSNTQKLLRENEIYYAGLTDYPYSIFEKDSITYGFCAFSPNTGTIDINDHENAEKIVKHLDSICDIVIVSFHGGAEGVKNRNITRQDEFYYGENRGNPYLFARTVIDAGADVVFGHGPHVTRAIDLYKERFIAYSLGNFATYGQFNLQGSSGVAPIIKVFVDNKGRFLKGKIISIKQHPGKGPKIDISNRSLKEMIYLTNTDIPEAPLSISENGDVFSKSK